MNRILNCCLLAFSLVAPQFALQASDLAKERRWADQIVDSLVDGEAVWLDAAGQQVLGIYTEAGNDSGRAAIVLHGIGVHPNWQQVVYPLRVGLAEQGWSTLSVQLPILANEAQQADYAPLFDEVAPRLDASVAFLRQHGAQDIVMVAHSMGASMGSYYLSGGDRGVKAFVGIGMGAGHGDPRMNNAVSLTRIRVPVLDLYGSEDLEGVVGTAQERAHGASGNGEYSQVVVEGADHFFNGKDEVLVDTVQTWMDQAAPLR